MINCDFCVVRNIQMRSEGSIRCRRSCVPAWCQGVEDSLVKEMHVGVHQLIEVEYHGLDKHKTVPLPHLIAAGQVHVRT